MYYWNIPCMNLFFHFTLVVYHNGTKYTSSPQQRFCCSSRLQEQSKPPGYANTEFFGSFPFTGLQVVPCCLGLPALKLFRNRIFRKLHHSGSCIRKAVSLEFQGWLVYYGIGEVMISQTVSAEVQWSNDVYTYCSSFSCSHLG